MSGRLFKYGVEFFKLPPKVVDVVADFVTEKWPDLWTRQSCQRWIEHLLARYRKVFWRQMKVSKLYRYFVKITLHFRFVLESHLGLERECCPSALRESSLGR